MSEELKPTNNYSFYIKSNVPSKDPIQPNTGWGERIESEYTEDIIKYFTTVKGEDWELDENFNIVKVRMFMRTQCPVCPGECYFDIEGPDHDVGLTGYSAIYNDKKSNHEPDCTLEDGDPSILVNLEYKVSQEYADNPYNYVDEL